ncbi:MAG: CbtA family protein [Acidimicrobiia bacterium]
MPKRFDPGRRGSVVVAAVAAGVAAGLVAALFLTISAQPSIEEAIRLEQAAYTGHAHDDEVVSRDVQRGPGLFAAYAVTGAGFGVLFAAAFVTLGPGRPDVFRRALVAGTVLAGTLTVSPWLKYPPNPPAVGDAGTLGRRQLLYVTLLVVTAVVGAAAVRLSRRLRDSGWDEPRRICAVVAAVVVPLLVVYGVLPGAPDPVEVPAALVWRFRLASLGGNLLLWTVLTLGFGHFAAARRPADVPAPAAQP